MQANPEIKTARYYLAIEDDSGEVVLSDCSEDRYDVESVVMLKKLVKLFPRVTFVTITPQGEHLHQDVKMDGPFVVLGDMYQ